MIIYLSTATDVSLFQPSFRAVLILLKDNCTVPHCIDQRKMDNNDEDIFLYCNRRKSMLAIIRDLAYLSQRQLHSP